MDHTSPAHLHTLKIRGFTATDPDRVLELRDSLAPLLETGARLDLDRDLARWSMSVIHKRLRVGLMRPEVAVLAARVAESFNHTPEGASLRAKLLE